MDFAVTATTHKVKGKECKKLVKYRGLARELKNLWSMKVTVIPIIVGTLETISKNLEKRFKEQKIRERIEIIPSTVLVKSVWILRKVLETWEVLLPLRL